MPSQGERQTNGRKNAEALSSAQQRTGASGFTFTLSDVRSLVGSSLWNKVLERFENCTPKLRRRFSLLPTLHLKQILLFCSSSSSSPTLSCFRMATAMQSFTAFGAEFWFSYSKARYAWWHKDSWWCLCLVSWAEGMEEDWNWVNWVSRAKVGIWVNGNFHLIKKWNIVSFHSNLNICTKIMEKFSYLSGNSSIKSR